MDHNTNNEPRRSAAHLTVPRKGRNTDQANLIDRLRALVAESGTNKNDQAIVAITVCIAEGINTARGIFEMLAGIGFDTRHVAVILKSNVGTVPACHRWAKAKEGRYQLLG